MMNKKKETLLEIENNIIAVYYQLIEIEFDGINSDEYYKLLKNVFINALKDEDNLLNSLTDDEIKELYTDVDNNPDNYDKLESNKRGFVISNRITTKLNKIIVKKDKEYSSDMIICNSVIEDYENAFLSLLDDEINKDDYYKMAYIEYKFAYIYTDSILNEYDLISNNFSFDKSIYLNGSFYADLNNINTNEYETNKDLILFDYFGDFYEQIFLIGKEANTKDDFLNILLLLLRIRASISLMSNELYNKVLKELEKNKEMVRLLSNLYKEDFINLLKKDREKHKTLSLKIEK